MWDDDDYITTDNFYLVKYIDQQQTTRRVSLRSKVYIYIYILISNQRLKLKIIFFGLIFHIYLS